MRLCLLFSLSALSLLALSCSAQAVWNRQGVVLSSTIPADQDSVAEPSVIYEGNPQILIGQTNVFKMWFGAGWTTVNEGYAESVDGVHWTRYGSYVITGRTHGFFFKNGSTYYFYGTFYPFSQLDQYTSSDGVNWTLAHTAVLTTSAPVAWDDGGLFNPYVWVEGGTWYMLYDAAGGGHGYAVGLATSPDGFTWTKSLSNPVISISGGAISSSSIAKIGSTYYNWLHGCKACPNLSLPTDLFFYSSTNLTSWAQPITNPILVRAVADEGVGTSVGQLADASILEVNGTTYLFMDATSDGSQQSGQIHVKLMTSNMTIAQIVASSQSADVGPSIQINPGNTVQGGIVLH